MLLWINVQGCLRPVERQVQIFVGRKFVFSLTSRPEYPGKKHEREERTVEGCRAVCNKRADEASINSGHVTEI